VRTRNRLLFGINVGGWRSERSRPAFQPRLRVWLWRNWQFHSDSCKVHATIRLWIWYGILLLYWRWALFLFRCLQFARLGAVHILYNALGVGDGWRFCYIVFTQRRGYLSQCYITHFASDSASIFSNLQAWLHLDVEEWVTSHIHMLITITIVVHVNMAGEQLLLTCHIYMNHDSDCDHFACQFLAQSFFGWEGCRFSLLYNIGCGLEKCYIMLHRVGGWPKNTIFASYNMWTAPLRVFCTGTFRPRVVFDVQHRRLLFLYYFM